MVQLLITISFIALFLYNDNIKSYSANHPEMWIIALVLTFVLIIVLACFDKIRRQWPLNIILLMAFTFFQGFLLGSAASSYNVYPKLRSGRKNLKVDYQLN